MFFWNNKFTASNRAGLQIQLSIVCAKSMAAWRSSALFVQTSWQLGAAQHCLCKHHGSLAQLSIVYANIMAAWRSSALFVQTSWQLGAAQHCLCKHHGSLAQLSNVCEKNMATWHRIIGMRLRMQFCV